MSRQISNRVNQQRELAKTVEHLDIAFENVSDSFDSCEDFEI